MVDQLNQVKGPKKTKGLCWNIIKTKLEQNQPKRTQALNFVNNQPIEPKLGGESISRMSARIVDHCYQRIYHATGRK